jgi:hypothetical protein
VSKFLSVFLLVLLSFSVCEASMIDVDGGRIEYELKQGVDVTVLFDAGTLSGMAS